MLMKGIPIPSGPHCPAGFMGIVSRMWGEDHVTLRHKYTSHNHPPFSPSRVNNVNQTLSWICEQIRSRDEAIIQLEMSKC